ncbi:MAG: hypothetical protein IT257_07565 [Chitinophagaceae bacterium]|nr:hypothetical protein [Chitinophagaceae bacterium]
MKLPYLYLLLFVVLTGVFSCKESLKNKVPIRLGDPSLIVTESDSTYLQNMTDDIAPVKKKSTVAQISQMMVQVDSLKTSQKMEAEAENETQVKLSGFTINFSECDVIFDGISAHALNATQNERASQSVSYLQDGGSFMEAKLDISNLSDVRVEERLFVKLGIENNGETLILGDLPKYITQWYNLAGKGSRFVSVGSNSLEYDKLDPAKLRAALEKELKKKKKNKEESQVWINSIAKTRSHSDSPCKLVPTSAQWRIWGTQNGKSVRKLIQFDIPY